MATKELYSYKYYSDQHSFRSDRAQLLKPLQISFDGDAWDAINNQTCVPDKFKEDAYNLMAGATNLVNAIESRFTRNQPIKTLVFLDRSGRLAAHLLTHVYQHIQEFGDLGVEFCQEIVSHKPAIRFINSGTEDKNKHGDTGAIQHLATLFRPEDILEGSTLIVDEIIYSGGSVCRTAETFAKAGYAHVLPAISMFHECPHWYNEHQSKGVADFYITPDTRERLGTYAVNHFDDITAATEIVRKYGWRAILNRNKTRHKNKPPVQIPDEDLSLLKTVMRGAKTRSTQTILYLASNGGFSALSPSKAELKQSRWYRQKLEEVLDAAFAHNLITIREPTPTDL